MKPLSVSTLQLVTIVGLDPGGVLPVDRVQKALRGGSTMIQLRAKNFDTHTILEAARGLLTLCHPSGIPVVINDRPDIALAANSGGAHVGPRDLAPAIARRILGDLILGVSARSRERILAAEAAVADYVGVGAVRETSSKPEAGVLGISGVGELVSMTTLPVIAIGGIRPEDLPALKTVGVSGVAVMSGIMDTEDPEDAARSYREAWTD